MDINEYIDSGVLEAFLLGALTREEEELVLLKLENHPELRVELQAMEDAMLAYAQTQSKVPPHALQDKIWEALKSPSQSFSENAGDVEVNEFETTRKSVVMPFKPEYRRPLISWKYAAMILALVGSVAINMYLVNKGRKAADDKLALSQKLDKLEANQKQLAGLLATYQKSTEMKADTGMQTIVMHTVLVGHPMAATIYWSKGSGEAYVAMEALPAPPKGMQYQLWAIQGGKPVDMGVLKNDMANTPQMQKVDKLVTSSEAFAISLEKEGGSPTPTAQNIYVLGKA